MDVCIARLSGLLLLLVIALELSGQDDFSMAEQLYAEGQYESVIEYVHSFEIRHERDLLLEGDAQHKLQDYAAADECYTQVLARNEDNAYALMRRGAVQLELGEFAFALRDVKRALRIWPDHPEANFHMGNVCYDQNDLRNATKYYKMAIESRPSYPQATYMLGAARSELGHHKEAVAAFESVLSEYPEAGYNLAVVQLEAENYEEALLLFNEVASSKTEATADLYFFRAETYFYLEDKQSACADYNRAAELGDEEAQSIYDSYCLKSRKKSTRKNREVERIAL